MAVLGLAFVASPAAGADLCASLTIPASLGLSCAEDGAVALGAVTVAPAESAFSALSRLTLRPLDKTEDPLAWSDPPAFLQRQMTLDTSSYAGVLGGVAEDPDSPLAGPEAKSALDSFANMLANVGKLPLHACDTPLEASTGRWDMACRFTAGGIGMLMRLRLVAEGDRRWAITMRAANDQRLRHFEAIANSFVPPT